MVAEAVVLELPVRYREVLPCGCYAAAIPPVGRMRWLRYPNWCGGSALFSTDDGEEILARGWVIIDGIRGLTKASEAGCPHWVEMMFEEPWTKAHP